MPSCVTPVGLPIIGCCNNACVDWGIFVCWVDARPIYWGYGPDGFNQVKSYFDRIKAYTKAQDVVSGQFIFVSLDSVTLQPDPNTPNKISGGNLPPWQRVTGDPAKIYRTLSPQEANCGYNVTDYIGPTGTQNVAVTKSKGSLLNGGIAYAQLLNYSAGAADPNTCTQLQANCIRFCKKDITGTVILGPDYYVINGVEFPTGWDFRYSQDVPNTSGIWRPFPDSVGSRRYTDPTLMPGTCIFP